MLDVAQDGLSAFELARLQGFAGTLAEWLASLAGEPGANGKDGKDGRDGIDGIDGKDGSQGEKGERGEAGTAGAKGDPGKQGPRGLAGADGKDGRDGQDGETPEHEWDGTRLRFKDAEGWGQWVELRGPAGRGGVVVQQGGDSVPTFETVSKNLKACPFVLNYAGGELASMTYQTPAGAVTKSFEYDAGTLVQIELAGAIPSGIQTIKTLAYVGGELSEVSYS